MTVALFVFAAAGLPLTIVGLFFAARSTSAAIADRKQDVEDRAVSFATTPIIRQLTQMTSDRDYYRSRCSDLEKELRSR